MKVLRLCVMVAAPLAFLSCSAKVPTDDSVRKELERRIAAESNGCMRLEEATKTNGYEAPSMTNTYVVVFSATIEFIKDCKWSSPMFKQGKHSSFATTITDAQARNKGGFWGEFFNLSQNPGAPFTQGTRVRVAGEQAFIKTEQGYQALTDMFGVEERERVFSDRDIRMALISQFETWNPGVLSYMEAQWAARPQAESYKTVGQIAVEAAEAGASSKEIRVALERELVPRYLKELPTRDGWGNSIDYFVYQDKLFLRSPGKDGKHTWTPSVMRGGPHDYYDPEDYDGDLVFCVDSAQSRVCYGPDIEGVNPWWRSP